MKKLFTIIMMAMVIFTMNTTKVEAKTMSIKERIEATIVQEFEKAWDDELGAMIIFVKDRHTEATLSDDFRTCTIDTTILINKDLIEEDYDVECRYVIVYDLWKNKIVNYVEYLDGVRYDSTNSDLDDSYIPSNFDI